MRRRGRPPYPDILTPREWEVLALLREGLSNEEIAQRLEFTLGGAKYHVSEILGKLGVATREEAAAWQPTQRPWWLAAGAPVAFLWRKVSFGWLPGLAAGVVIIPLAMGLGLLVWGLLRMGGNDSSSITRPFSSPTTPALAPTPSAIPNLPPQATPPFAGQPFEILGPIDRETALSIDNLGVLAHFVLDLPTGQFYVIRSSGPDINVGRPRFVQWLDDETLLLEMRRAPSDDATLKDAGSSYRVRLDGTAVLTDDSPVSPPNWQAGIRSPDGAWTATLVEARFDGTTEQAFGSLLVGRPNEDPSYRLSVTSTGTWTWWPPSWSPDGHLLAFTGNVCRGFDLFVFDPENRELRNLTASLENQVLSFAWRPDGSSLAASVFRTEQQPSTLQLIDLATGSTQMLLESPELVLPQPIAWNPSGDRLLFNFFQGGWCEEVGVDIPPPPPTRLEILSD